MKKLLLSFLLIFKLCFFSTSPTICFSDTQKTKQVGPGIFYHEIIQNKGPWAIQVLEIDLTNPYVSVETIKAKNKLVGRKKTSELATSVNKNGHWVVGAINADYFSASGIPHGVQVDNGRIISDPSKWSVFGLFKNQKPFVDILSLNATVISDEGKVHPIHHVNKKGAVNEMVLFSRQMGEKTEASENSIELILSSIDGQLLLNDSLSVVIDSIKYDTEGCRIRKTGFVLAADGKARKFIENYAAVNDTWKIFIALDPTQSPIEEAISGGPRIVRNGKISVENLNEGISDSFATTRHPRTAIGFGPDSTRVYFVTVDGRQPGYSVGMSLYELADFMVSFGIAEATNLDGGGSTTMVVRNAIVNRPADKTGERPVANAIFAVSSAPLSELNQIKIVPEQVKIIANTDYHFLVEGFDRYYNPVPVDQQAVKWEIDPGIGEIKKDGQISVGKNVGQGMIVVRLNDLIDTTYVNIINVNKIALQPNPIVLEMGQTQKTDVKLYDEKDNNINQKVDVKLFVTDGIGAINSAGIFSPTRLGQGYLIGTWGAKAGSTKVFIGKKTFTVIEDFEDISDWHLNTIRANPENCQFVPSDSVFSAGNFSGKLRYQLEQGGTSAVYCNTSIPIFGEPYSLSLRVNGDGKGHWLRGEFEDKNGHQFIVNFTEKNRGVNWKNEWKVIQVNIAEAQPSWGNPSATIMFPITWKKIYIAETDENGKNSGVLYFDDLAANYIQFQ